MTTFSQKLVKSCPKLESGLRFGPEGIRACQLGPFAAPLYWTEEEAADLVVTKDMIVEKRKELFMKLNDDHSDIICKKCSMVVQKEHQKVDFTKIGRIDHAPRTICNLRCNFCGFTHEEARGDGKGGFVESKYDSIKFLDVFDPNDVLWDSAVDFNGGETSLLKNLKNYFDYFKKMKISVLCFSNGVKFSPTMATALREGTIQWLVISVDAGTASTYNNTKRADVFPKVLENITKYASCGGGAGGSLAIKYIFTEYNCSDDDVYGFVYAMLAIQPQKIWLTYDFGPFSMISPDSEDFLHFDFSKQIQAYVKMYLAFCKHGVEPVHYTEGHLAKISVAGKRLLKDTKRAIDMETIKRINADPFRADLIIKSFRTQVMPGNTEGKTSNLQLNLSFQSLDDLLGHLKQELKPDEVIAIAPAVPMSELLVECLNARHEVYVLDRNPNLWGRSIGAAHIHNYKALERKKVDTAIVVAPKQHEDAIIQSILKASPTIKKILNFTLI